MVQVPNLEGMTLDKAQDQHGENFDITQDGQEDSNKAENVILSQDPEPGTRQEENSEIGVTVASGRNDVPGVVGNSPDEARQALESAGFGVAVKEKESVADREGQVISQNPGGGNTADVGSEVEITVGTGVANVEVPNLYGMSLDKAAAEIRDAGLTYNGNDTAPSDEIAEGNVISQSIAAGTSVEPGTGVGIRISTGPDLVSVPDLYGYTLDEAAAELESLGLQLGGDDAAPSDEVSKGGIIGQSSAAGTSVEPGTSVGVTVSSGPEQTSVPNLYGSTLGEAKAALENVGLKLGSKDEASNEEVSENGIISQSIATGTTVEPGTKVDVTVSSGPESARVPDVIGDDLQEAQAKITSAGFAYDALASEGTQWPAGTVLYTDPPANAQLEPGSEVTIGYSAGPASGTNQNNQSQNSQNNRNRNNQNRNN